MKDKIPGLEPNFFPKYFSMICEAFKAGDMCIIECKEEETGKIVRVLANVSINEGTRRLEFLPLATLFEKNPMHGMAMVDGGAVLASQKSMAEWVTESNSTLPNVKVLN